MVDTVDNTELICLMQKVRITCTIYEIPGIVARDRQQTLAILGSLEQLSNDVKATG